MIVIYLQIGVQRHVADQHAVEVLLDLTDQLDGEQRLDEDLLLGRAWEQHQLSLLELLLAAPTRTGAARGGSTWSQ